MHIIAVLGIVLFALSSLVDSAKILAIFPAPGASQYILVQPYLKNLAARGHEVTVISAFPQKQKIHNFRDIPVKNIFENYDGAVDLMSFVAIKQTKWEELNFFAEYSDQVTLTVLETAAVQKLLRSSEHFDLIVVETLHWDALYYFGVHFKAPLIGVSSFGADRHCDQLVGNPSPLSYIPLVTSSLTDRMTYAQRLLNLYHTTLDWIFDRMYRIPRQTQIANQYFPHIEMGVQEMRRNFSLMLINQHFTLSFPRPYVPNMIEVGGFHLHHDPAPLPIEIEAFLNASANGVIYFSLGSNIKSNSLPPAMLNTLMEFFATLPYGVMWKFENTQMPDKPKNVFISKWFPQPDILAHPKVKVFFTHGGLLSMIESIYHGKPVVGMPIFYDQHLNVGRAERLGFGVAVDVRTFTNESLKEAFDRVLNNPTYSRKAVELSRLYRDQPMKPIDTAIYWTEYVLRYKGAPHMRAAAQDLNFIQYHSIDTFVVLYGGALLVVGIIIWLNCWVMRKFLFKMPTIVEEKKMN